MKEQKRALLASNLFYPNVGGVENSLAAMTQELCSRGWGVDIIVSDFEQGAAGRLPRSGEYEQARVSRYRRSRMLGPLGSILSATRLIRSVRLAKGEADLVIARSAEAVVSLRASGMENVIYIVPAISASQNAHDRNWKSPKRFLKWTINAMIQKLAFRLAGVSVVLGKNMQQQVIEFTRGRVNPVIVPPGVDLARFHPPLDEDISALRGELGLPVQGRLLLGVGRFANVKGFDLTVNVLAELPPDVYLVLVGDGPCKQQYEQAARALGVESRLILRDRTLTPEKYYAACDTFVFASHHEPFGQVLLEATATGLPVVAFEPTMQVRVATAEIYDGFDSLVEWASWDDLSSFAQAIRRALDYRTSPSESFLSAAERFRAVYSWGGMVDRLIDMQNEGTRS